MCLLRQKEWFLLVQNSAHYSRAPALRVCSYWHQWDQYMTQATFGSQAIVFKQKKEKKKKKTKTPQGPPAPPEAERGAGEGRRLPFAAAFHCCWALGLAPFIRSRIRAFKDTVLLCRPTGGLSFLPLVRALGKIIIREGREANQCSFVRAGDPQALPKAPLRPAPTLPTGFTRSHSDSRDPTARLQPLERKKNAHIQTQNNNSDSKITITGVMSSVAWSAGAERGLFAQQVDLWSGLEAHPALLLT